MIANSTGTTFVRDRFMAAGLGHSVPLLIFFLQLTNNPAAPLALGHQFIEFKVTKCVDCARGRRIQ
jgi:hypothetical protein